MEWSRHVALLPCGADDRLVGWDIWRIERPLRGTTPPFADVPCSSPFAPFIAELRNRGVTAGCTPTLYCPTDIVTRAQMAVFSCTRPHGSITADGPEVDARTR